jgi:DedD protein
MAFFKFRSRGPQANEGRNTSAAAVPAESVESMRRRARHRLLGAAILLLVGVIGFPLLFDTQPRPIAVDIPIEIPDRNKVAPLPQPAATAKSETPAASVGDSRVAQAPSSSAVITESADGTELPTERPPTRAPAATSVPVPAPAPAPAAKAEVKPEPKPKPKTETRPETVAKPAPAPAPKPAATDDGARARALLEGQNAAAARQAAAPAPAPAAASEANGRFVIQVGAFADAAKAREVRQKLERAGLKTYTNVAKTADGERTRVRVGPFGSRTEADQAAGKVKGLALPASVLGL